MTLAYQDFWPSTLPMRRAPGGVAWEPLAVMMERVNKWLETCTGRVINVETVLIPVAKKGPATATAGGTLVRWDEDHAWVQVVRVWYEVVVTPPVLPAAQSPSAVAETPVYPAVVENPAAGTASSGGA
jgi:hypothetical protein